MKVFNESVTYDSWKKTDFQFKTRLTSFSMKNKSLEILDDAPKYTDYMHYDQFVSNCI